MSFGPQTGMAVDRYLRARRPHRLAGTPKLWLGADNWRDFNYFGLRHALEKRAQAAGIPNFHLHLMRHRRCCHAFGCALVDLRAV